MSIYRLSAFIAYDHSQGAFMFFEETSSSMRMIAAQYITAVEPQVDGIHIVCDTKHLRDSFSVKCKDPEDCVERIDYLLEQFR